MSKKQSKASQAITLTEQYQLFKKENSDEVIKQMIELMESVEAKPNTPDLKHLEEVMQKAKPNIAALNEEDREIIERVANQKVYNISKKINKTLTKWNYFKEIAESKKWEPILEIIDIINTNEERFTKLTEGYNNLTDEHVEDEMKRSKEDVAYIENLMKNEVSTWIKENTTDFYADLINRSIKSKLTIIKNRLERSVDIRFSKWLKETRKAKKITLTTLGEKTDISPSYIQRLEAGTRKMPTFNIIKSIAEGLDVPLQEVFDVIEDNGENREEYESTDTTKNKSRKLKEVLTNEPFALKGEVATDEQRKLLIKLISVAVDGYEEEEVNLKDVFRITETIKNLRKTLK